MTCKIQALAQQGKTTYEIARELNIPRETVIKKLRSIITPQDVDAARAWMRKKHPPKISV